MDDSKIIELFYRRSEQAIEELGKKYGKVCAQIAYNILRDTRDSEECVNDTYLGVWNTVPPQKPDPLRTYVYRIVRNLSIAKYHAKTAQKRNSFYDVALEELDACLASGFSVESELSAKQLPILIDRFLDTLDQKSRVMFVRRYWYADSITAIAEKFHMKPNNVSVHLSRTRNKLKKYLVKEGYVL